MNEKRLSKYRLRNPESKQMYICRLEQINNIWDEIVQVMFSPIEDNLMHKDFLKMVKKGKYIKEQLERICDDPWSFNNRDLSRLSYMMVDFAQWCFNKKNELSLILSYYSFEYDDSTKMIKIDGEDIWYLGIITSVEEKPSFF